MDIRSLKLFLHLSSTLHFGRTSRACNITRSGLTRTIQRLENELGEQLFFRNNRSVRLTENGILFREYASDVIQRFRSLKNRITAENPLRGELSIYSSVTAVLSILPEIINDFRLDYPDIHLKLSTGDAAMALTRLENGEADLTVAALPGYVPPSIRFLKLLQTPLIFIGPRSQESDASTGFEDWLKNGVIMPERGLSRVRCEHWFAEKQISPQINSYVAGNEAMIAMVAMGCGIGVVPKLVLDNSPLNNRITILHASPTLEPFDVGICTTKNGFDNPIVKAFWRIVELRLSPANGEHNAHDSYHQ